MTPTQRLKAMRSNRGRTQPEIKLAHALWRRGFRYYTAKGYRSRTGIQLIGNPDIVFPKKRVIIFVDGCFWHGCNRCHNFERDCNLFWQNKIQKNILRDRRISRRLRSAGWTVIRIREHELRPTSRIDAVASQVIERICHASGSKAIRGR
jgi:DNA mismatch endonuclease (patch repair protein)